MIKNIYNLGDAALYCDFGDTVNKETNLKVINYFNDIREKNITGIKNIAPSYNKLIIYFDLELTNYKKIKDTVENLDISTFEETKTKVVKIPVCFDDEFALDLERVEKRAGLVKKEIVNQLISQKYFCYMTGFIAGMPFLGDIKEKIRLDRLETPRVKVPKGSVGITEQFCNIYTFESPGGWNIVGNSPKKVFTKDPTKLTLIDPGDEVEFFEISKKEYSKFNEQK